MWSLQVTVLVLVWLSGGQPRTCLDPVLQKYRLNQYHLHSHLINDACAAGFGRGRVLVEFKPICYANFTYFFPCSRWRTAPKQVHLEWYGHVMGYVTSRTDFQRLLNSHQVDWLNGTSYSTAILYFPHAAQALIPMLNIPLLGTTLRRFVVSHFFAEPNNRRTWEQHYFMFHNSRWLTQLAESVLECLGMSFRRGDEAFYHDYNTNEPPDPILPPRPSPPRLLCFDRLFMPQNAGTCSQHFVSPSHAPALWAAFRSRVFARFRVQPLPRSPLRIAVVERHQNRRILNQAELLAAIRNATGAEVVVLRPMDGMGLDVQVRSISSFHVVIGPHGANMMNCLFLSPGAVAIEVHLGRQWMQCYYGDLLRNSGIPYRRYCNPFGPCSQKPMLNGEYPRHDATVNVSALVAIVLEAAMDIGALAM